MPVGPFVCDFICRERRLIVEVDGGQHAESQRDIHRTAFLEAEGYRVIRFWNDDVLGNIEGVLHLISEALTTQTHPLIPSRKREGRNNSLS
jgi:very-short-patch-repair endonuclease